jgi:protein-S-isoprenylcysteine O-methyltransferase Ste14
MRLRLALGSGLFFALAPATVAGLIPYLLTGGELGPPLGGTNTTRAVGGLLALAGWAVLVEAFVRFARVGLGTPAPIAPPSQLVISGFYRHVRNPMYVAVLAAILGEGLLWGRPALLLYGAGVGLLFHLFVTGYEEPHLLTQFGEQYAEYRRRVPRWLPKLGRGPAGPPGPVGPR